MYILKLKFRKVLIFRTDDSDCKGGRQCYKIQIKQTFIRSQKNVRTFYYSQKNLLNKIYFDSIFYYSKEYFSQFVFSYVNSIKVYQKRDLYVYALKKKRKYKKRKLKHRNTFNGR